MLLPWAFRRPLSLFRSWTTPAPYLRVGQSPMVRRSSAFGRVLAHSGKARAACTSTVTTPDARSSGKLCFFEDGWSIRIGMAGSVFPRIARGRIAARRFESLFRCGSPGGLCPLPLPPCLPSVLVHTHEPRTDSACSPGLHTRSHGESWSAVPGGDVELRSLRDPSRRSDS